MENVDPLPVRIQSTNTEIVCGYAGLACMAVGLAYSVYRLFTAAGRAEEAHELEMQAADNYERQTRRQAETAELEYQVAREKAAQDLGKSLEELEAMLKGDAEAIIRNLPQTNLSQTEEAAEATA